jgi:hypothetical protein
MDQAGLRRRGIVTDAVLYAFDLLEFGGEDLRPFRAWDTAPINRPRLCGRRQGGWPAPGGLNGLDRRAPQPQEFRMRWFWITLAAVVLLAVDRAYLDGQIADAGLSLLH